MRLAIHTGRWVPLFAAALWLSAVTAVGWPQPVPIRAKAAVLMDADTGVVILSKAARDRRPMASTTKIMTALVVLESANRRECVTVSPNAPKVEPSVLDLKPGERLLVDDLLTALLLRSANDAAIALAEHVSGSVEAFAGLMTERARQLGARDTRFANPHGLHDPEHYSSAYDLALVTREALKHRRFRELVGMKAAEVFRPDTSGTETVENRNKLLWQADYVDGVKTGWVRHAGQCIVASGTKRDWQLIVVLLDSPDRYEEALQLLEYGFSAYSRKIYVKQGEVVSRVPVRRGRQRSVPAVCTATLAAVMGPGLAKEGRLTVTQDTVAAPVARGDRIGEATLLVDGKAVARSRLVAGESVPVSRLAVFSMWALRAILLLVLAAAMVRAGAKVAKAHRRRRGLPT